STGSDRPTTPLMDAAFSLELETVEFLIDAGANAAATDANDANVLHHLAQADQSFVPEYEDNSADLARVVARLLAAGADPRQKDAQGRLPVDIARSNDSSPFTVPLAEI